MISNLPWYKKFFLASFLFAVTMFGYWYFNVPKLAVSEQDDKMQKEREQLNQEIGQRAFNRLKEKYGDE